MAADVIEEAGWTAIEAEDSEAALNRLREHPEVGLLFTDVRMPAQWTVSNSPHACLSSGLTSK
jgi:CheY-like chemotaxis protein